MKDYIIEYQKGKEDETESTIDINACDGEEWAEEEVHTDDPSVSDATEPEKEESEEEVEEESKEEHEEEVKEKKIQHMSVWTSLSDGWLKGLQEINSTRPIKVNPHEERESQEKKTSGNGLVMGNG